MNCEIALLRKGFSTCRRQIKKILSVLTEKSEWKFPVGDLSIAFLGDDQICEMHEAFLKDPSKTDVITFPGDIIFEKPRAKQLGHTKKEDVKNAFFAGEICICVDQALRMSKVLDTTPEDELLLYLVHGWLHLAGFNDLKDDERKQMRLEEAKALKILEENQIKCLLKNKFPKEYGK